LPRESYAQNPPRPPADLELLRKFDTPTICNVVELFDVRSRIAGYMDKRIQACYPKLPADGGLRLDRDLSLRRPADRRQRLLGLTEQIASFAELPGPPVVVFQDLDNPVASATFGEVMCTTYKTFGAVGLITSGAARDIDQVEVLNFPCFADGVISAHGYCHIVQVNLAVHVGGVMVRPGDLLHGDRNGVTTIPNELAAAVAHACPELAAAESIVLDYLKAGKVDPKGFDQRARAAKT